MCFIYLKNKSSDLLPPRCNACVDIPWFLFHIERMAHNTN